MIPETRDALDALAGAGVPLGVVSNASGQIETMLVREVCQVGPGDHVEMRCIVDSHVVGVAKPDPAIFDHALPHFAEFDRSRIAYVGDSVTMDIAASSAAGLHPILLDPYDDHADADFERIRSVADLAAELVHDVSGGSADRAPGAVFGVADSVDEQDDDGEAECCLTVFGFSVGVVGDLAVVAEPGVGGFDDPAGSVRASFRAALGAGVA
jgi:hypothetical protein